MRYTIIGNFDKLYKISLQTFIESLTGKLYIDDIILIATEDLFENAIPLVKKLSVYTKRVRTILTLEDTKALKSEWQSLSILIGKNSSKIFKEVNSKI